MENQFKEIEVFDGKNLSDIFQEIYTNHETKKNDIKELIGSLTPLIEGLGDATLLVPLIKEYLEISVKNDDQLVKLAQIVQRIDSGKKAGASGNSFFDFSDLQGLLEEDKKIDQEVQEVKKEADEVVENKQ